MEVKKTQSGVTEGDGYEAVTLPPLPSTSISQSDAGEPPS